MTDDRFEQFWKSYPRRVCKGAARTEYAKALKKTDHATIMEAVERYKLCKPDYQDWAHPRTWLYQERWDDEWDAPGSKIDQDIFERAKRADQEEEHGQQQAAGSHLRLI